MMYWLVAFFGAVGVLLRFAIGRGVEGAVSAGFPYGTLFVNVLGSFLAGLLTWWLLYRLQAGELWRNAIIIGFLGGFTTFSGFSMEVVAMLEQQDWVKALSYIVVSVVCCIVMCFAGIMAAKQFM